MRAATTLTSKGQVVIPKAVRERMRWPAGTRLSVEVLADGGVRLASDALSHRGAIDLAFGLLTAGDPIAALEAEHRAEVVADEQRRRR